MNEISAADNNYITFRFRYKKLLCVMFGFTIFILGSCSYLISVAEDMKWDFLSDFRFMTINGTLFTSVISLATFIIGIYELMTGENIRPKRLYFLRLISVVTECVIAAVILMSFLPFVPDSPNILKFDSFIMHIVIPILTILSFLIAEPPEGKIKPIMRMNGSALITIYAVVIISLILVGVIPQNKIPYSFLEVNTRPLWYVLLAGAIVYAGSYFLSWGFIEWNRRISDNWYK